MPHRAVARGAGWLRRWAFEHSPLLAFISALLFTGGLSVVIFASQHAREQQCQAAVDNRAGFRLFIDVAERATLQNGSQTEARIAAIHRFYGSIREEFPALRCDGATPVLADAGEVKEERARRRR